MSVNLCFVNRGMTEVKPLILAAGKATRMGPDRQKVILPLLGRPMLQYVLDVARAVCARSPAVVVGHMEEQVREAFSDQDVDWIHQERQRGTGHAVQVALAHDATSNVDHLLVLCGDVPGLRPETLEALRESHVQEEADVTILTAEVADPSGYGRVVRDSEGDVERIVEEAVAGDQEREINEINSGVMMIDLTACEKHIQALEERKASGEIYLTDLIAELKREGGRVKGVKCEDSREIQGVNTPTQRRVVTDLIRKQVLERLSRGGVEVLSPAHTYVEPEVTIGRGTVIEPFVVVRNGVQIGENCHLGPFCHLRRGTILEDGAEIGNYVETKNSEIGSNTKAKHLAYLGDAEIGRDVNIGAGTITANYDGVRKHRTTIKDGASTGSNSVLVAPVTLGENSRTGAGAVVLQNEDIPEGETAVGVPARRIHKQENQTSEDD